MTSFHDDFPFRVNFAASVIARGRPSSRKFNACFENDDGDVVSVALLRRTQARPLGKLAKNIWRYLCEISARGAAERLASHADSDLVHVAAKMRAKYGEA